MIINWALFALVIWLAGLDRLDHGLTSAGFWPTLLGAVIVSLVSWAASAALERRGAVRESRSQPNTPAV